MLWLAFLILTAPKDVFACVGLLASLFPSAQQSQQQQPYTAAPPYSPSYVPPAAPAPVPPSPASLQLPPAPLSAPSRQPNFPQGPIVGGQPFPGEGFTGFAPVPPFLPMPTFNQMRFPPSAVPIPTQGQFPGRQQSPQLAIPAPFQGNFQQRPQGPQGGSFGSQGQILQLAAPPQPLLLPFNSHGTNNQRGGGGGGGGGFGLGQGSPSSNNNQGGSGGGGGFGSSGGSSDAVQGSSNQGGGGGGGGFGQGSSLNQGGGGGAGVGQGSSSASNQGGGGGFGLGQGSSNNQGGGGGGGFGQGSSSNQGGGGGGAAQRPQPQFMDWCYDSSGKQPPGGNPNCFINDRGFQCCSREMNDFLEELASTKTNQVRWRGCNIQRMVTDIHKYSQQRFNVQFETFVGSDNVCGKHNVLGDWMCKTRLVDGKVIMVYAHPASNGFSLDSSAGEIQLSANGTKYVLPL